MKTVSSDSPSSHSDSDSEPDFSKVDVWGTSALLRTLSLFLERSGEEYYGSEVSLEAGVSLGAANENLKKLSEAGFLNKRKEGRMVFYRLNQEDEMVRHLKIAKNLSKDLIEELKEVGEKFGLEVYIYGSVARGEDRHNSDWDILFIGDVSSAELQGQMDKIDSNVEINTSLFTRSEWNQMEEEDPAFYERVEKDKIRLI